MTRVVAPTNAGLNKGIKILKKMDLKIGDVADKKQEQVGAELILEVFENLHLAEAEVNELLADMVSMTVAEFEELEIDKTMEIIKEFKNIKGLSSFFKRANQSTE